jgi:hypothetical protein
LACLTTVFSVCGDCELAAAGLQWRQGQGSVAEAPASSVAFRSPSHRDAAVDLVAYNEPSDSGPQFDNSSTGRAKFRSVIVRRDEPPEEPQEEITRSAQLPTTEDDALFDHRKESGYDELPDMDTFTMPDDEEESLLDETDQSETYRAPQTFQPPSEERRPTTDSYADEPERVYALGATSMEEENQKAQEFCSEELADLKANTLDQVKLNIAVDGRQGEDIPYECSIDDGSWHAGRCWSQTTYMWKASALCHKPLYFENEQLERYGHSWGPCCQPLVSGAHFFSRLPVLPYCMGVEPPCECVYALGHYRPGNCAPYMCDAIPLSPRGALIEAGAAVGTVFILP